MIKLFFILIVFLMTAQAIPSISGVVSFQIDSIYNQNIYSAEPQFPGGNDSLIAFINRNLQWPSINICAEGRVIVEVKIDSDGYIKESKIIKSLTSYFDNEAIKVVNIMPKWIPAKNIYGESVEAIVHIPFYFAIRF